jgi:hypothetical protein
LEEAEAGALRFLSFGQPSLPEHFPVVQKLLEEKWLKTIGWPGEQWDKTVTK